MNVSLRTKSPVWPSVLLVVAVGAAALLVQNGPVSPLMLALIAGVIIAQLPWQLLHAEILGKTALRLGVALLGLRLSLAAVAEIGVTGVAVVLATVAVTYVVTRWLGRKLGIAEDLTTLVAVGFSICGAAAIAGIQDLVKARREAVAQTVAMVTVFGTAMIVVLPMLSSLAGLDQHQAAVWAGASIHEVAQVIAAASIAAPLAVGIAATVKLARVMLLAPMSMLVSQHPRTMRGMPWFVIAFIVAVGLRTTGRLPSGVLDLADQATTALLAAGMFTLGLGARLRLLVQGSGRLLVLSAASTVVAAGSSFLLVLWFA